MFLARYNRVTVWGVKDPSAQQRVIEALRKYYREAHCHRLQVIFMDDENWTGADPRGPGVVIRGPERMIRVVNIG